MIRLSNFLTSRFSSSSLCAPDAVEEVSAHVRSTACFSSDLVSASSSICLLPRPSSVVVDIVPRLCLTGEQGGRDRLLLMFLYMPGQREASPPAFELGLDFTLRGECIAVRASVQSSLDQIVLLTLRLPDGEKRRISEGVREAENVSQSSP